MALNSPFIKSPMQNSVDLLSSYLPQDRRAALARGESLPDRVEGTALFADLSGFTPLTEQLAEALGPRRGVEALSLHLNTIYDTLIAEVERFGGSVVSFAGDAIICWFAGEASSQRAVACSFAMHQRMKAFQTIVLPNGNTTEVAVKTSVASGRARRFVIGNPQIQLQDILAGEVIDRMAAGEKLAHKGETIVDTATVKNLKEAIRIVEWRADDRFALILPKDTPPSPFPDFRGDTSPTRLLPEQLQPWLIPAIYTRIHSGQGEFLTELRPGVPVFVQFSGINFETDDGLQLDLFIRRVQDILTRYEGTLIDITVGDKGSYIHISFGAITIHEDDPRRAVQAALEIQQIPTELTFLRSIQIGIGRGTLRTGAYGGQTRRMYGALGDDVNLAARLMEAAQPGDILVSGRIFHALADEFEIEPRPPLHVKGKVEPVPVFVVKGMRHGRAIRLQEPQYALPLVGRQSELAQIAEKMGQVVDGKGQIVGVVAEAGMGKSRLVAEVIHQARKKGFIGYGGACQSGGVATPYLVWRLIGQAFLDVDTDAPVQTLAALLQEKLQQFAPHRLEALPLLGTLLGLPLPDNSFTQALEPEFRKSALEALVVDCLKGAFSQTHKTPLLFVLEDLHWIDPLSRDLLEEVARACADLPVLLVLAYRPFETNYQRPLELEKLPAFTRISLAELTNAELEILIRNRLGHLFPSHSAPRGGSTLERLVAQISARVQGNPFYAEELINYLHDQGLDPYDPAALDKTELPNSLHQLILSRIDQLTEREKSTLKVASVIGRLFPVNWLHGYYPTLGTLEEIKADLEELRHLDLTPLDTPEPELAYLFKHIVTQEVTYESLSYEMRARLHEHLATYLENTVFPTRHSLLDLLAYHYGRSHNAAKQREYYRKAGEAAQNAYANEAAVDYYTRLLLLLPPIEQIEILLKRGTVYELMGNWEEALEDYTRALSFAEQHQLPIQLAQSQQALGVIYRWRGEYDRAMTWFETARAGWEALGHSPELIQTQVQIGIIHWRKGDFAAARTHLEASLTLARQENDLKGMAFAINNLGNVAWRQGDHAAAQKFHEENLTLRRQLGGKRGIAIALNNVGAIAHEQGDYSKAMLLYRESLALAREMGDKQGISLSLDNLGMVALDQGDHTLARSLFQESLVLAWELGDKTGILSCLSNLGNIAQQRGDFVEAYILNEQALNLAREIDDKFNTRMILQNLGFIAFQQADIHTAQRMYQESLELSTAIDDKRGLAHSFVGLAGIMARQGAFHQAGKLLAAAEKLKNEIHQAWESIQRQGFEETYAEIQHALGPPMFAEVWSLGEQLSLDEAIALAKVASE
ncbi:MAG: adenylate/guanylate cyclase domain-containing protein [Anaerolineales bacterium]